MSDIPGIVVTYLQNHAPKGTFIGYWRDRNKEYNVLILCRNNDEFGFSVGAFPEVVGHWGHQVSGSWCSLQDMKSHLDHGLWEDDEQIREILRNIVCRLENNQGIDDIIATCRSIYDPRGITAPPKPAEPRSGPRLTSEGQYSTISALVKSLTDENPEISDEAARKLAGMGITEDNGPLFARNALFTYRKRRTRVAPSTPDEANKTIATNETNKTTETVKPAPPPKPPARATAETKPRPVRSRPERTTLAYALMFLGCPALVLVLGVLYGMALTAGKADYIWTLLIAGGIWLFFVAVVKLCRFKQPRVVFTFAIFTALGVVSWGHYVDYDWVAKEAVYERVRHNIRPRGQWVPGTREYRAWQPGEIEQYPSHWQTLNRDDLYAEYLRRALQDEQAGGFVDHLRVRAEKGFISAPYGKRPAGYRGGFWVWWAWSVHALMLALAALLSSAASFMERESEKT